MSGRIVAPEKVTNVRAASDTTVEGTGWFSSTLVVGPCLKSNMPLFMSIGPANIFTKTDVTNVDGTKTRWASN